MTEDAECLGREDFEYDFLLGCPDDVQTLVLVVPGDVLGGDIGVLGRWVLEVWDS